jgi:hypothetical protein
MLPHGGNDQLTAGARDDAMRQLSNAAARAVWRPNLQVSTVFSLSVQCPLNRSVFFSGYQAVN